RRLPGRSTPPGRAAARGDDPRVPPGYQRLISLPVPGIRYGTGATVFETITVIGSGRVGAAVSARLRERGIAIADGGELVLVCVPDAAIPEVARSVEPGRWVGHVSGASPLAALAPHALRFSVHPLQTF